MSSAIESNEALRKSNRSKDKDVGKRNATEEISWSKSEVEALVKAIHAHGHLNYEEINKAVPNKSTHAYKCFLKSASIISKESNNHSTVDVNNINDWMTVCDGELNKHNVRGLPGSQDIAIILSLLSVDGLLEYHPLPEDCGGIDFAACYRLLSQAVLGHPIQPVNKKTIQFLYSVFTEMCAATDLNSDLVENVKANLNQKNKTNSNLCVPTNDVAKLYNVTLPKKRPKVYQRKKPNHTQPGNPKTQSGTNAPIASSAPDRPMSALENVCFNPLRLPPNWLYNSELVINIERPFGRGVKFQDNLP